MRPVRIDVILISGQNKVVRFFEMFDYGPVAGPADAGSSISPTTKLDPRRRRFLQERRGSKWKRPQSSPVTSNHDGL